MILDTEKNREILLSLHEGVVLREEAGFLDWDLDWDLSDEAYEEDYDIVSKELVGVFDDLDKDAEKPVLLLDFRYIGPHTRLYVVWVPQQGIKRFEFVEGHYEHYLHGKPIPSHWRGKAPPKEWGLAMDWRDEVEGSLDRSISRTIYGSSYGKD